MLIGRQQELERIGQRLALAARGSGTLSVLYGEPGIAKTRLADEITQRALEQDFLVSWGRASETGGAPAYWPWIVLLTPLADGDAEQSSAVSALIGLSPTTLGEGVRGDPERERFELFESVTSFLRRCSRHAPLLLVFDDLHMADIASLELLSFVAPRLRRAPIAFLATWRDAESRSAAIADVLARISCQGEIFPLRPFSSLEVSALVVTHLGSLDPALAAEAFELTEGNPLSLFETLNALATKSRQPSVVELREVALRGGVLGLVRGRLAGAAADLRALLEACAVVGRELWLPLLTEVCQRTAEEVELGLDAATARTAGAPRRRSLGIFARAGARGLLP